MKKISYFQSLQYDGTALGEIIVFVPLVIVCILSLIF